MNSKMDSLNEKTKKQKKKLAENYKKQIAHFNHLKQLNEVAHAHKAIAILILVIFLVISLNGFFRFEIVRGTIFSYYYRQILISSFILSWIILSFISPNFKHSRKDNHAHPIDSLKILFVKLGVCVILSFFLFSGPMGGFFTTLNSINFNSKKIHIAGIIKSIQPEIVEVNWGTRYKTYNFEFRVIEVLNIKDQKIYRIDVPKDYFDTHKISVSQPWNDLFYIGMLNIPFRNKGRWSDQVTLEDK